MFRVDFYRVLRFPSVTEREQWYAGQRVGMSDNIEHDSWLCHLLSVWLWVLFHVSLRPRIFQLRITVVKD